MTWIKEQPTMVVGMHFMLSCIDNQDAKLFENHVGADVSHPSPGLPRPSFAAVASSVDMGATKYVASCRMQAPRREIIEELKDMLQVSARCSEFQLLPFSIADASAF